MPCALLTERSLFSHRVRSNLNGTQQSHRMRNFFFFSTRPVCFFFIVVTWIIDFKLCSRNEREKSRKTYLRIEKKTVNLWPFKWFTLGIIVFKWVASTNRPEPNHLCTLAFTQLNSLATKKKIFYDQMQRRDVDEREKNHLIGDELDRFASFCHSLVSVSSLADFRFHISFAAMPVRATNLHNKSICEVHNETWAKPTAARLIDTWAKATRTHTHTHIRAWESRRKKNQKPPNAETWISTRKRRRERKTGFAHLKVWTGWTRCLLVYSRHVWATRKFFSFMFSIMSTVCNAWPCNKLNVYVHILT